ncbi:MAG TPA: inositol monophosphatase family protein, partial [Pirellulales bacterium]
MSAADLSARLELALSAAKEAGDLTLTYFQGKEIGLEIKEDKTPVTIADKKAEELLRDRILAKFPHDGVLGEEMPEQKGSSGYRWILDPIDGTKSFVAGVPLYGTMVGIELENEKRGVVGVVRMP